MERAQGAQGARNRKWICDHCASFLARETIDGRLKSLDEIVRSTRASGGYLAASPGLRLRLAVMLMAAPRDHPARKFLDAYLELIIGLTAEALRTEDFGISDRESPAFAAAQVVGHRAHLLGVWYHAEWFRTGKRNLDRLRQSVDLNWEFYGTTEWFSLRDGFEYIFPALIHLCDWDRAVEFYRSAYAKALPAPSHDKRMLKNEWHVLYALAEWQRGDEALAQLAKSGIEAWYTRRLDWTDTTVQMDRVLWAYLRGKYLTGETDIRELIYEMRGY